MKKRKTSMKRFFAFLLAFMLAFSTMENSAWLLRAEEQEKEPEEAISVTSQDDFGQESTLDWDANNEIIGITVSSGIYRMENDIILDHVLYIPEDADVTIIFNGKTLKRELDAAVVGGNVIWNKGKLSLGTEDDKTGFITGGYAAMYGGGVYNSGECNNYICIKENMAQYGGGVYSDKTFYNYGDICLNSNFGTYTSGGGVYITNESKFTNNGNINENTATSSGGGVVITYNSEFINNGSINKNTSGSSGGGVSIGGNNGGTIINNGTINENTSEMGGGVEMGMYGGTLINKGAINYNHANICGGGLHSLVYSSFGGSAHIENTSEGTIDHNTSLRYGGVSLGYTGYEFINSGSISYNEAEQDVGGIYLGSEKNELRDGTVIKGNKAGMAAGGIQCPYEFEISGKVDISDNTVNGVEENISLYTEKNNSVNGMITIVGKLEVEKPIGVNIATDHRNPTTQPGVLTNGYGTNVSNGELKYFTLNSMNTNDYALFLNENKELEISEHVWAFEANGNELKAYCKATENHCKYAGSSLEEAENVLTLTFVATDETCNGYPYDGIKIDGDMVDMLSESKLVIGEVNYEGINGTVYTKSTTAPIKTATYKATVDVNGFILEDEFEIKVGSILVTKPEDFGGTSTKLYFENSNAESEITHRVVYSGEYILQNDITLDYSLYIPEGEEVTIILDGYTLKRELDGPTVGGSVIWNLGDLTLGSEEKPEGVITGGNEAIEWRNTAGGIQVGAYKENVSASMVNYVTISGNTGILGGGVGVSMLSSFTNYGCIKENTATKGFGGGVYNYGEFINYGDISYNSAASGGGITNGKQDNNNPSTINYGNVDHNYAITSGGGVWSTGGTFTNNGSICENKSESSGGGINALKSNVINNGFINNNETAYEGGGVNFYAPNGAWKFINNKGATINNNKSQDYGGGVSVSFEGSEFINYGSICYNEAGNGAGIIVSFAGKAILKDETKIIGNKATICGGGVYLEDAYDSGTILELSGKVEISNNETKGVSDNISLLKGKVITIADDFETDKPIGVNIYDNNGVSSGVVTSGYGANVTTEELKYFKLDDIQGKDYALFLNSSGELEISEHNWIFEADGKELKAYCNVADNHCKYAGSSLEDAENVLTLTFVATDETCNGYPYNGTKIDGDMLDMLSERKLFIGDVYYEGIDGTVYAKSTTAPIKTGIYKATVRINGLELNDEFEIRVGTITVTKPEDFGGTITNIYYEGTNGEVEVTHRVVYSGEYILKNDITLDYSLYIPEGEEVTIILDGYTLKRELDEPTVGGSVIWNFGDLTLGSEEKPEGVITGGNEATKKNKISGGIQVGLYNYDVEASLINYVTLKGNSGNNSGAVTVSGKSNFYNYGIITENYGKVAAGGVSALGNFENYGDIFLNSSDKGGGAVSVNTGKFVNHGKIYRNSTSASAGAINMSKGTCVNYGSIYENNASSSAGAINMSNSNFENYGSIKNNVSGTFGGGIVIEGIVGESIFVNHAGATIDGNECNGYGGGVVVSGANALLLNSGSISGNECNDYGGAIAIQYAGNVQLKDGTTITGNKAGTFGGAIYSYESFEVSGMIDISGNTVNDIENDISIDTGKTINIGAQLNTDKLIRVNIVTSYQDSTKLPGVITSNYGINVSEDELKYFKLDPVYDKNYALFLNSSGELEISEHNWVFEADGNELKAFCDKDENHCEYAGTTFADAKKVLTLTLEAGNITYNGAPYSEIVIDGDIKTVIPEDKLTIGDMHYEGIGNTNYTNTTDAPVNAGTYKAVVVINNCTLEKEFRITKLKLNIPPEDSTRFIYNGTEQVYNLPVSAYYRPMNNRKTLAGEYIAKVYLIDPDNTEWSDGTTGDIEYVFKIYTADRTTVTVDMDGYVYNTTVSAPSLSAEPEENADVTYYYSTVNGNTNGIKWENITATTLEPGTYYIYAVISATDNYNSYVTQTTQFEVSFMDMNGIVAEDVVVTYDGNEHGIVVNVPEEIIEGVGGNVTIKYGTAPGVYELDECPKYSQASSESYKIYYQVTGRGYNVYEGMATLTINPKEVNITWGNTEFTYDGEMHKPTVDVVAGDLVGDDICNVIVSGEQKYYSEDAYTATATGLDNPNYKLSANTALTTEFVIGKKVIEVSWTKTEFTYDGTAKKPVGILVGVVAGDTCNLTVSGQATAVGDGYVAVASIDNENYRLKDSSVAVTFKINKGVKDAPVVSGVAETIKNKADGKIDGLTALMEYRKAGENEYTPVTDIYVKLQAGTYYVRYAEDANHIPSAETTVTVGEGRMLSVTLPSTQTGYVVEADKSEITWHEEVKLSFELLKGYDKTAKFVVKVNGVPVTLIPSSENAEDIKEMYIVASPEEDLVITVEGVADITAPDAEITLGEDKWSTLFNKITYGLFFKETQTVTITATDLGSGLKSIEYYLANDELSLEELKSLTDWAEYTEIININPSNEYIVYVKATDNVGNTAYISSDGIVVENVIPVINDVVDGAIYCGDVEFTVTEEYVEKVIVDDVELASVDGKYLIVGDNKTHTITVTDKAGNSTVIAITVNADHEYVAPTFTWSSDYSKATATFTCVHDSNHVEVKDCEITLKTKEATCTEEGLKTYTAKLTFNGQDYSDVKTEKIDSLGHSYKPPVFTWESDYSKVTASFVCEHDADHTVTKNCELTTETTASTCTEEGLNVHTAKITFEGKSYSDVKEEVLVAKGHTEGEIVEENYITPTCEEQGSYDEVIYCTECEEELKRTIKYVDELGHSEAEAVEENYKAPGCEEKGNYDEVIYCTECEKELKRTTKYIDAIGHSYKAPVFTWESDYSKVTASFVCEHDADHTETKKCELTTETTAPTCTEEGLNVHTAKITFEGKSYNDVKEEVLAAKGHTEGEIVEENYITPTCEEQGSYDEVIYCTECEEELKRTIKYVDELGHSEGEKVEENHKAPTCEEQGSYDEVIYCTECEKELERVTKYIDKLGHIYGEPVFTWNADYTEVLATFTCGRDSSHVETKNCEITKTTTAPTCTEKGIITYTVTVTFEGKSYSDVKKSDVEMAGHIEGNVVVEKHVSPSCEEKGSYEEVVYCTECKAELSRVKKFIDATGHSYGTPVFSWSEDFTNATTGTTVTATATFTCDKNLAHVIVVDCEVTSELVKAATGTEQGEMKYVASVVFEGTKYTDEKVSKTPIVQLEQMGDGNLITEVFVGEDVPPVIIENLTIELAKKLLEEEELDAIINGEDIIIFLETLNMDGKVSDKDMEAVLRCLKKLVQMVMEKYNLVSEEQADTGMHVLDISLYKQVGDNEPSRVTETGDESIVITVGIPEDMQSDNAKRMYRVVRVHGDEETILDVVYDSENQTLTFETDKFSTYAIIYAEPNGKVIEEESSSENDTTEETTKEDVTEEMTTEDTTNDTTGDLVDKPVTSDNKGNYTNGWLLIMMISAVICMFNLSKSKRNKN